MSKLSEQDKIDQLHEVQTVLDLYEVPFWLDCGTLLGAVRDKKFIPWDSDADLGTWKSAMPRIMKACRVLQDRGYELTFGRTGIGFQKNSAFPFALLLYEQSQGKVVKEWGDYRVRPALRKYFDLFSWLFLTSYYEGYNPFVFNGWKNKVRLSLANIGRFVPEGIRRWLGNKTSRYTERYFSLIPEEYFAAFTTILFYDLELRAPRNYTAYLAYRYGDDWQTPISDWNGAAQDGSIKNVADNGDITVKK